MRRPIFSSLATGLTALMLLAGASVRVDAESQSTRAYVTAGLAVPYQNGPSGETVHQTFVAAPGEWTTGWLIGAGFAITPRFGLDVELSSTGTMSAREPTRYDRVENVERRDRFLTVGPRLFLRAGRTVRLEPSLGLVLAFSDAWFQTEYYATANPPQLLFIDAKRPADLPVRLGLAGGLDLRVGGPHFAVVPSLHVIATAKSDTLSTFPGGFPTWTFRPGLAIRADF